MVQHDGSIVAAFLVTGRVLIGMIVPTSSTMAFSSVRWLALHRPSRQSLMNDTPPSKFLSPDVAATRHHLVRIVAAVPILVSSELPHCSRCGSVSTTRRSCLRP